METTKAITSFSNHSLQASSERLCFTLKASSVGKVINGCCNNRLFNRHPDDLEAKVLGQSINSSTVVDKVTNKVRHCLSSCGTLSSLFAVKPKLDTLEEDEPFRAVNLSPKSLLTFAKSF